MKKLVKVLSQRIIITILVLLILAVVAIGALQNTGIITHAQNATTEYHSKQDEEEIKLAIGEWKIVKHTQTGANFGSFLKSKFGENNVSKNDEDEFYIVTIAECGHKYKVYEDGRIEKVTGIFLNKTSIKLDLADGVTTTEELTANLSGITGTIRWESDNESIAEISGAKEGETITVTIKQGVLGTAIITATCGEYKAEYIIKVTPPLNIAKGAFVEYDVAYTDAYGGYTYTTINGWRLLDYTKNADGTYSNVKLMSTGIPAMLYYYYNDTTNNSWWVTDDTTLTNFREVLGGDDYFFYGGENYYALQAAAGLYYNFGDIKFAYGTTSEKNKGYFTSITSNGTTYDNNNTEEKIGDDLFKIRNDATIRLLTWPESKERVYVNSVGFIYDLNETVGLHNLKSLSTVDEQFSSYVYGSESYWLASPSNNANDLIDVGPYGSSSMYFSAEGGARGVRPVICITSNVQFEDLNGDGALEIK